jgi:acyl-coenzyme A synthetase/AMP-(fatty) acid ligase
LLGYWNTEKNSSVLMNKHILGDIVSIDEFGRYIFVARNEDILKIRGYRYTPQYIEDMYKALLLSDMVKEMVVFVQNEQPQIAFAISIEDYHALRETLPQAFLTLPHWLRPRTAYFFAQELPKTPRGKLSRKWIANLCQHHPTRQNLS